MKHQIEYVLGRELKKCLREAESSCTMGRLAGPAYFDEGEYQWLVGRAEGIKLCLKKLLAEKNIDEEWFLCKLRPGPMPARYRN